MQTRKRDEGMEKTYEVEEWSDELHVMGRHSRYFRDLTFIIVEKDLFSGERVCFLAPDRRHPFCTSPESTGDIINVDGVCRILTRSPTKGRELAVRKNGMMMNQPCYMDLMGFFMYP
jgi:hypothetical protein